MRRALGLDERQMRMIMDVARSLPVARRDEFLRDISAHLGEAPTMLAIEAAIGAFFERTPAFSCDAKVKEIT